MEPPASPSSLLGAELGCSRSLWSPSLPCSRCVPRVQDQEDELANKKQGHKKKRETEMLSDGKRSRRCVQLKLSWGLPKQAAAGGDGRSEAEVAGRGDAEAAPPVPATEPAAEKKVDEEPEKGKKKGKPQKSETEYCVEESGGIADVDMAFGAKLAGS